MWHFVKHVTIIKRVDEVTCYKFIINDQYFICLDISPYWCHSVYLT